MGYGITSAVEADIGALGPLIEPAFDGQFVPALLLVLQNWQTKGTEPTALELATDLLNMLSPAGVPDEELGD